MHIGNIRLKIFIEKKEAYFSIFIGEFECHNKGWIRISKTYNDILQKYFKVKKNFS